MEWLNAWIKEDKGFLEEARERALPRLRYLFYRRGRTFDGLADLIPGSKSKVYFGLCTHCGKGSRLEKRPEHNGFYTCPVCGRVCIAKADGRGTRGLFDKGGYNFIRWHKGSLYILHCRVWFAYCRDKYHPDIGIEAAALWRFGPDGAESYQRRYEYKGGGWRLDFKRLKGIAREKYGDEYTPVTPGLLEGGFLENSRLAEFTGITAGGINDIIGYITAYQKRPNIANLVNERQYRFVKEYACGNKALANRLIDWRRVRPHEMLRVQKEELPELERIADRSIMAALFYQKTRAAGQRLTARQTETLIGCSCGLDEPPMTEAIKRRRIPKALNYIERQYERDGSQHRHRYGTITMWRDYLDECRQLGYDLGDDSIYYPADLLRAHGRTMQLIRTKSDKEKEAAASKRALALRWMSYSAEGLCIRPAESADELREEGGSLCHCVASYAERYIKGDTAIFFIRLSSEPDKPYFTLELDERKLTVRQNRGLKNCAPPREVKEFVERWLTWLPEEKRKLKKKEKAA